jgi:hypothetical protein
MLQPVYSYDLWIVCQIHGSTTTIKTMWFPNNTKKRFRDVTQTLEAIRRSPAGRLPCCHQLCLTGCLLERLEPRENAMEQSFKKKRMQWSTRDLLHGASLAWRARMAVILGVGAEIAAPPETVGWGPSTTAATDGGGSMDTAAHRPPSRRPVHSPGWRKWRQAECFSLKNMWLAVKRKRGNMKSHPCRFSSIGWITCLDKLTQLFLTLFIHLICRTKRALIRLTCSDSSHCTLLSVSVRVHVNCVCEQSVAVCDFFSMLIKVSRFWMYLKTGCFCSLR